ncbi:DUF3168 domain-containing protein [Mycobacterium marinum]|uniref:DUF3168 domain-containing protein n=1 Tax=Mycobacterium marinum TaxID=1781 RepID=UPI000B95D1D3|nr:DUF3168 domain-containing protein [Mycobacterium marinum]
MTGYPTPKAALKAAESALSTDAALAGVAVGTKIPNTRPSTFVRVGRAGGYRPNIVTDVMRVLVEVWAPTVAQAETICNQCIAALQNAQGTRSAGAFIRAFDNIEGPIDLPEPDVSSSERWQFTGDLYVSTN